jgi:hypothetical protein
MFMKVLPSNEPPNRLASQETRNNMKGSVEKKNLWSRSSRGLAPRRNDWLQIASRIETLDSYADSDSDSDSDYTVLGNILESTHIRILPVTVFFWLYSQIHVLAASMNLSVLLQLLDLEQSVGLLGRVINSSQGLYLYTNTEKRTY